MGIKPDHMKINLRGGGACCSSFLTKCLKKEIRRISSRKDQIMETLKAKAKELAQLITKQQQQLPQMINEEAIEIINTLTTQNKNLQQYYIRTNMFYQIQLKREHENDIYEILLNSLQSLQAFIQHSIIKTNKLILLCLDLFYIIYKIQIKLNTSFLNDSYSNQYSNIIRSLKDSAEPIFKYEILMIDIVFQNCRKQNAQQLKVSETLFNVQNKFDIIEWFTQNAELLNKNYEEQEISISNFELFCFYQRIKWTIILEVENGHQENLDIPKKILQFTFSQHLQNQYSFFHHKYWIQLLFELISCAQFQPIQSNQHSQIVQTKFQELSKILIESYVKFYASLKIKDSFIENFKVDPHYQPIEFLKKTSQSLEQEIENIKLIIQQLEKQQNKELLNQLKNKYLLFIQISIEIYQTVFVEIEKVKLVDRFQSNPYLQFKDGIQINPQEYINEIDQSKTFLLKLIIKIEKQLKNVKRNKKKGSNKQQQNQTIKFPNSIYFIIDKLQTKTENQYFKHSSEIYWRQFRKQSPVCIENEEFEKQQTNIKFPLNQVVQILSVRFNDSLNQKEINCLDNQMNLLLNSDGKISIDDLYKIYKNVIKYNMKIRYQRTYQVNKKQKLVQYSQEVEKINLYDKRTLKDIVKIEYQNLKDITVQNDNVEIVQENLKKFHDLIQEDKQCILHISIDDSYNKFQEFYRKVLGLLNQILPPKVKIQSFDQLKPVYKEIDQLYHGIIKENVIENVEVKFEQAKNIQTWEKFKQNLFHQQKETTTTINFFNKFISLLSNLEKTVYQYIQVVNQQDDENEKKNSLQDAFFDITKCIKDYKLIELLEKEKIIEIVNPINNLNFVEYVTFDQLNKVDSINFLQPLNHINFKNQQGRISKNNQKGMISKIDGIVHTNYILNSNQIANNKNDRAQQYFSNKFIFNQVFENSSVQIQNNQSDLKQAIQQLTQNDLLKTLKDLIEDMRKLKTKMMNQNEDVQQQINDFNQLKNILQNTISLMTYMDRQEDRGKILLEEIKNFVKEIEKQKRQDNTEKQINNNNNVILKNYKDCILNYKNEQSIKQYHFETYQFQINPIYIEQRFKIKKYDPVKRIQEELVFTGQLKNYEQECHSEIKEFLQNTEGCCEVLLLFGQQGSGKSRELKIIQDKLWEQYNSSCWIPIFISLSSDPNSDDKLFLRKLQQIFQNDEKLLQEFQTAVNSKQEKVLFLLDDIDEVKINRLQQNLIKLNFQHLDFNQNLIGVTVKFIVSARCWLKDFQNYQLYFTQTNINFITELELLPFNDEQRQRYFQLKHLINIKNVLFAHFSKYCKEKEILEFEKIWKNHEINIQNHFNQQEDFHSEKIQEYFGTVVKSLLIEKIEYDQHEKIVQELLELKCSQHYLNIIQNHHFQHLTQTPFQLEIFILLFSIFRQKNTENYFKVQLKKLYTKLKQKYLQSSENILRYQNSQSPNNIPVDQSMIDLINNNEEENIQQVLTKLKNQQFQYKHFNILKGDTRGIQMDGRIYQIKNDSIIVIEALRANNMTMYQILKTLVTSLNKTYAQTLRVSYDLDFVLEQMDKQCEKQARKMTIKNLTSIDGNFVERERQQSNDDQLNYNSSLIIQQGNTFTFKHKIIQEYYFAQFLKQRLTLNINRICNSELNSESINLTFNNFAGAINILRYEILKLKDIREKLIKIIKMSKNHKYTRVSSNCIYLISVLNFNLVGEDLQNINLSNTDISGISFFKCNLSGSTFKNVIINRCNFDFAQLNDVKWSNIQIIETSKLEQNEDVQQVIFSPDGKFFVSLSAFWLRKWEFKTFNLQKEIENLDKTNHYLFVAVSNINEYNSTQYIATCSLNEIVLRDFNNFDNILHQIQIDFKAVGALQFSPNSKIVGFIDSYEWLRCWNSDKEYSLVSKIVGENEIIKNSHLPFHQINKFSFDKSNSYFLFQGKTTLKLFELLTEKILPVKEINATQFIVSSDGKSLAVANKYEVILYDWQEHTLNETLKFNLAIQILQILSYNSNQEIGLQFRDDLALWSIKDKCLKGIFKGYQNLQSICFHPYEKVYIQWNDTNKNIKVWNMNEINPNKYYDIFDSPVLKAEFSPNGQLIVLQLKTKIIFWDYLNDECIDILNEQNQFCFSPSGKYLATTSIHDGIILYDSSNIYELQRRLNIADIYSIEKIFFFSNNNQNKLAIIANSGELLKIWQLQTILDTNTNLNKGPHQSIICIAVSPTDSQFAYVGNDQKKDIIIYDEENNYIKKTLKGHRNQIISIEYSYNGQLLASRGQDNFIRVWFIKESGSNSIYLPINYNENLLDSQHICTWIPNQQLILASNEGNQIILWKILFNNYDALILRESESKILKTEFQTYSKSQLVSNQCNRWECLQVQFSPNVKYIAASYFELNNQRFEGVKQIVDPRIVIWDWEKNTELISFQISFWQRINFHPNSESIISLDYDDVNHTNILKLDPIIPNVEAVPNQIQLGFTHRFTYLVFSPKSRIFFAVREEIHFVNHIFLYDFSDLQQPTILDYFQVPYGLPLTFNPNGEQLAYSNGQTIQIKKIWNVDFPTKIRHLGLQYNWKQVVSFTFIDDQTLFGFYQENHKFISFNNSQTIEYNNEILNFDVQSVSFYNNMMACGGGSERIQNQQGIVKIINMSNLDCLNEVQQIISLVKVIKVFFSENGKYLLIQEKDQQIKLWQQKDQNFEFVFWIYQKIYISSVCFSSNYTDFIIQTYNGNVMLYNLNQQLEAQEDNNQKVLCRLKTIPKNYVIQAMKCQINNAQIQTKVNSLKQLFKYQGAIESTLIQ